MNVHNGRSLTRSEHRRHDRLLVTRFAMDDAYPTERDEALKLVESCSECAALAADVRTVATAMPRLPVAPRTRSFTITAEQADRLRGSGLSRWLRTLAMPGWGALRPVAGVALSIGLVMAVVGAGMPGTYLASERLTDTPTQAGAPRDPAVPSPVAGQAPQVAPETGPPALGSDRAAEFDNASPDPITDQLSSAYVEPSPSADGAEREELRVTMTADPARDLLVYAGLMIAALSFALLALAWIARRYFADPLLR